MKITVNISDIDYELDFKNGIHLAIPLLFNGAQPNTYDVKEATADAYRAGDFVGSVAQGGPCNFESYELVPHCNGTHTECVGHISENKIDVHQDLEDSLIPATLVSIRPTPALDSGETYAPPLEKGDMLITSKLLEEALKNTHQHFCEALVIRTIPNDASKMSRRYLNNLPSFFSHEAMRLIHRKGVRHLLVDLPSVDRTFDNGLLSNHRIFWNVPQGQKEIDPKSSERKSITEMIFVKDEIQDGNYLLNLQMAAFMGDASPSRPILYNIKPIK